jgi:hypothetical protein
MTAGSRRRPLSREFFRRMALPPSGFFRPHHHLGRHPPDLPQMEQVVADEALRIGPER